MLDIDFSRNKGAINSKNLIEVKVGDIRRSSGTFFEIDNLDAETYVVLRRAPFPEKGFYLFYVKSKHVSTMPYSSRYLIKDEYIGHASELALRLLGVK